jgi:hypothetical protein
VKKRTIQITNGCATCKPNLVATAAEGQSIAKPIPVKNHSQPAVFLLFAGTPCCFNAFFAKIVLSNESKNLNGS